jgi:hypothetical protein
VAVVVVLLALVVLEELAVEEMVVKWWCWNSRDSKYWRRWRWWWRICTYIWRWWCWRKRSCYFKCTDCKIFIYNNRFANSYNIWFKYNNAI